MHEPGTGEGRGRLHISQWNRHPQYFNVRNIKDIPSWNEQNGFEKKAAVLGCGAYGQGFCMDEFRWLGSQMGEGVGVIYGIDPDVGNIIKKYNPDFEKVKQFGSPDWVNKHPNIKVGLVNSYSGNPDLLETIRGSLDHVLVVAPEPSDAAGIITDAMLLTKPGGVATVVFNLGQYMFDTEIDDMTPTSLLERLSAMFGYKTTTMRVNSKQLIKDCSRSTLTHFPMTQYKAEKYPLSPQLFVLPKESRVSILSIKNQEN